MNTKTIVAAWAVMCAAVCLGCRDGSLGTRHYTAKSWIHVASQKPSVRASAAQPYSDKEYQDFKKSQRLLVKSRFVLLSALRKPEVAKQPEIRQILTHGGDPVGWLESIIKVEFPDDAEIMSVSCNQNDPHAAAVLVNAVVDAYLADVVKAEREIRQQRLNKLELVAAEKDGQLRNRRRELNSLTAQLTPENSKAAAKPVPVDIEMLRGEIKALEDVLHELRLECERAKIELQASPRVVLMERAEDPLTPD